MAFGNKLNNTQDDNETHVSNTPGFVVDVDVDDEDETQPTSDNEIDPASKTQAAIKEKDDNKPLLEEVTLIGAGPCSQAKAEDLSAGPKEYIHIRIQQRDGSKSLTTVEGLKTEFPSYDKILKGLKKLFGCNGTVVPDPELGQVIQLEGDQRKKVSTFLVKAGIVKKDCIKIHGFKKVAAVVVN